VGGDRPPTDFFERNFEMGQYIVTTPKNPQYSGRVGGVLFQAGKAFVSEHTINPALGRSADEVAKMLKDDFGYDVQPVNYTPPVVEAVLARVEPPVENPVAVVDEAALNAALSREKATPRPRVVLPRKNQNKKRDEAGADVAPEES
jgi:hypothetical protein